MVAETPEQATQDIKLASTPTTTSTPPAPGQHSTSMEKVSVAAVATGGTAYVMNDILILPDGVELQVSGISGSVGGSAVSAVVILEPGATASPPVNPVAQLSTTGSGTGATFNLTWVVKGPFDDYGFTNSTTEGTVTYWTNPSSLLIISYDTNTMLYSVQRGGMVLNLGSTTAVTNYLDQVLQQKIEDSQYVRTLEHWKMPSGSV